MIPVERLHSPLSMMRTDHLKLLFVVFDYECCVSSQYNLLESCRERILIQPGNQVINYSLSGLTLHIWFRISIFHLSIPGIVVHGRCYILLLALLLFCLSVSWFLFLFLCVSKEVWVTKSPFSHFCLLFSSIIVKAPIQLYKIILLHHIIKLY